MAKIRIGTQEFVSQRVALDHCRAIRDAYPGTAGDGGRAGSDRVTRPEHVAFLRQLLACHPDSVEKTGSGIDHFEVRYYEYGTRAFCIVRSDGTETDFSFQWCVKHAPRVGNS